MNIDDLTPEEFKKMFDALPEDAKEAMQQMYLKSETIQPLLEVKQWLDQFDNTSPIDGLSLKIAHQFIGSAGQKITQDMKKRQEKGSDYYSSKIALSIVTDVLEEIMNGIKSFYNQNKNH